MAEICGHDHATTNHRIADKNNIGKRVIMAATTRAFKNGALLVLVESALLHGAFRNQKALAINSLRRQAVPQGA
jgi:hypothetical protein